MAGYQLHASWMLVNEWEHLVNILGHRTTHRRLFINTAIKPSNVRSNIGDKRSWNTRVRYRPNTHLACQLCFYCSDADEEIWTELHWAAGQACNKIDACIPSNWLPGPDGINDSDRWTVYIVHNYIELVEGQGHNYIDSYKSLTHCACPPDHHLLSCTWWRPVNFVQSSGIVSTATRCKEALNVF